MLTTGCQPISWCSITTKLAKHISFRHCETLIHAFVTSKIDHYNILLSGLKQDQVRKLQYVQNSAGWLLTGTCKCEHITPVLRDLHWLPVNERIRFKILLMTFKCLNQLAPSYLSDLLIHHRPSRTLNSSDKELLVQPHCHLKTYGEGAFSFIALKLWNTLSLRRYITTCACARFEQQHAKKVVSDSPGLVDFAIGLVNSVLNLPDRQVKMFRRIKITKVL